MQGILITLIAVTALAAPPANQVVRLEISPPSGERATIELATDGKGVTIEYVVAEGTRKVGQKRHFDAEVLDELRGAWGPHPFQVADWHSDSGCGGELSWRASAGGEHRTICRNEKIVARLGEFQQLVQALMGGKTDLTSEEPKIKDVAPPKSTDARTKMPPRTPDF